VKNSRLRVALGLHVICCRAGKRKNGATQYLKASWTNSSPSVNCSAAPPAARALIFTSRSVTRNGACDDTLVAFINRPR
jgi:hypothetical protein